MWPGVEFAQGEFSDAYIKKLKSIVNAAAKRGIYTLLDMHQDVLSENFCGEGNYSYFMLLTLGRFLTKFVLTRCT